MSKSNTNKSRHTIKKGKSKSGAINYSDFVISAVRKSLKLIEVQVRSSPAGKMSDPVTVSFAENEVLDIRNSFYSANNKGQPGRMLITQADATELGKRLSEVLFPARVFQLLSKSLAIAIQSPDGGLRIRLDMDESLTDLPWEYLYRPDRLEQEGVSGFLLLDPSISIVRMPADARIALAPITGKQRLAFVGTLWEGDKDIWEVRKEFKLLKASLKPVSNYLSVDFAATSPKSFTKDRYSDAAIFHYAGHCDFDNWGSAYLIHEVPLSGQQVCKTYITEVAELLGSGSPIRLVVLSACNSGFWPAVKPLLKAGVPAVVGINGAVNSRTTIEFCAKLYESLAIGLTLDEAVNHARLHILEWDQSMNLFDWGLFMIYMPSPQPVIFPRKASVATATKQKKVRAEHGSTINSVLKLAENLDGMNFGEIMSELINRRVLILGRFTERRLKILEAIKQHLAKNSKRYIPELFTFQKPENRDLTEAIKGFASLSKFIIADLSEPKSVQSELEAIVPNFLSVPVVPIINRTGKVYATFSSIERRENVIRPVIRYDDVDDLLKKLDKEIVPRAEAKLNALRDIETPSSSG